MVRTHDDTNRELSRIPCVAARTLAGLSSAVVVDLRSESEFAVDHVPGACNLPLLDDAERVLVGTLYRRESPEQAFDRGREFVAARIDRLVEAIGELAVWSPPPVRLAEEVLGLTDAGVGPFEARLATERKGVLAHRPIVLCCWRGGMRSRSVALLLRQLGLDRACVLDGGYRAWRRLVMEDLAAFEAPPTVVLRGLTGVGKTLVLRELERIRPRTTLDLEELARHRSSILGMVGLEPVSQKAFENRLRARLALGFAGVLVVEGESRKVGDAIVPERVWRALDGGESIELTANVERRVRVLLDDYLARPGSAEELLPRLAFLDERLGISPTLVDRFRAGAHEDVVRVLLERYYDPLYGHGEQGREHVARFDATNPHECAHAIAAWIESRGSKGANA